MSDDKKTYPLLETNSEKMPDFDQPNVEVIGVSSELPVLSIKKRKFTETEEFMTVAGIEETIKKIEDKIASLQVYKEHHEQMLKFAKANEVIALDDNEVDQYRSVIRMAKHLKELEEKQEKTPELELDKKKTKESIHSIMEGLREPIRAKAEKDMEDLNKPKNAKA